MHPAPSVIFFSTFSGLGFGLLFWLGFGSSITDCCVDFRGNEFNNCVSTTIGYTSNLLAL